MRIFDLNPIVEKYVKSQKQLFDDMTEEYLIHYSAIIPLGQEQVFRLKRFKDFIQHLEVSIKDIFGDEFEFDKQVFNTMERYYGYTCQVIIRNKSDKMVVIALGYDIKNINLVYIDEIEENLRYFKGDR